MKRLLLLIVLFAAGLGGQAALFHLRRNAAPVTATGVIAALGGFRSLAAEAIWFRADRLQDEGRYVELAQLASTLTFLEPHVPEVWSYAAWNLAYNISVMMPTYEDRWRWVLASLRLLRDDGLRLNPACAELYREIAWLFEIKIGTDLDSAAALYRANWKALVEDVAARDAWEELAMDRAKMREITARYGITDWTNPQASAVYWSHFGIPHAKDLDLAFLKDILKQSLVIYRKGQI